MFEGYGTRHFFEIHVYAVMKSRNSKTVENGAVNLQFVAHENALYTQEEVDIGAWVDRNLEIESGFGFVFLFAVKEGLEEVEGDDVVEKEKSDE